MGHGQADGVAGAKFSADFGADQRGVFVAHEDECCADCWPALHYCDAAIGRKRFVASVDREQGIVVGANHPRIDGQCGLEGRRGAAIASQITVEILFVHEDVGPGLFGQ